MRRWSPSSWELPNSFEAVTGFSYVTGLTLFGLIVVFYTTVGGFKGVAITDAICAVAMIIGLFILFFSMLETGGGYERIMTHIQTNHPDMLNRFPAANADLALYQPVAACWCLYTGTTAISSPRHQLQKHQSPA